MELRQNFQTKNRDAVMHSRVRGIQRKTDNHANTALKTPEGCNLSKARFNLLTSIGLKWLMEFNP